MRVKLCFGVISWCFQAVKTLVSHHFHQVSWSFLGCSSWIWPHQMTLNMIHSHYGNYLQDFQDGVAINSWLRCVDLTHRSFAIWGGFRKTPFNICLSFFRHISLSHLTNIQHGSPSSSLRGVSAPSWIFLKVHQGLGIQSWNVHQKDPKCSTNLECREWNGIRGDSKHSR